MNDEKLKNQLGANIAALRKRSGMTQAALAERINFSDKAVSKWERGESIPDVLTLMELAQTFDVSVDALLRDPNALPDNVGKVEQVMGRAVEKTLKRKADKKIIERLCSVLVWFVALFIFVVCSSFDIPKTWLSFFYAVPVDCIVVLVLRSAWRDFRSNRWLISGIMWGFLVSIYMTVLVLACVNLWKIFLLGIPGQIAILLWFRMFRKPAVEENNG
ncbi:MAG: helix-turn-helix transcriptional regulator [Oscillospiraceae bacterium]|nr:helix-turn-helix transcriptional regulator [Oscillospiraceae bacterium]